MTTTIAVAGKGGTGKTTLSGLLVRYLIQHYPGKKVLAIDADPSSNLHLVLGLTAHADHRRHPRGCAHGCGARPVAAGLAQLHRAHGRGRRG